MKKRKKRYNIEKDVNITIITIKFQHLINNNNDSITEYQDVKVIKKHITHSSIYIHKSEIKFFMLIFI